jgi:hypothetical protein
MGKADGVGSAALKGDGRNAVHHLDFRSLLTHFFGGTILEIYRPSLSPLRKNRLYSGA